MKGSLANLASEWVANEARYNRLSALVMYRLIA